MVVHIVQSIWHMVDDAGALVALAHRTARASAARQVGDAAGATAVERKR